MKKLLKLSVLMCMLAMTAYGQKLNTSISKAKSEHKSEITDTTNSLSKDPDIYVYKCEDSRTKQVVYVDLLEEGFVGFFTNKTLIKYKVNMYALSARDTSWLDDYVSILFQDKMPVEALQFNSDESKISIYIKNKDGSFNLCELKVINKLKGLSELLYVRKRNKYANFTYGTTVIPLYISY